jgi:hypothetical protein
LANTVIPESKCSVVLSFPEKHKCQKLRDKGSRS